ncbi:hypothetical protein HMPREF3202_01398 [Prevotella bivia]|uniref:Uncharacterized protein n=1 Tax=Prevotella bivia TaxID=28125 RepID=A0A137SV98_9BACT|nr:hypothetical protein HMPREF3202_01398 [Prevotella bivia]
MDNFPTKVIKKKKKHKRYRLLLCVILCKTYKVDKWGLQFHKETFYFCFDRISYIFLK